MLANKLSGGNVAEESIHPTWSSDISLILFDALVLCRARVINLPPPTNVSFEKSV